MLRTVPGGSFFLVCLMTLAVNADTYFKYRKTTDAHAVGGKEVPASTSEAIGWIGDKLASFEDGEGHRTILASATRTLTILNLQNKTFSVLNLDSMQSVINDAIEAKAADAGEAAAMKAMMQGLIGMVGQQASMTVTKTAEQQKIGQWQCTKFIIDINMVMGSTKSVSWMTGQIKVDPVMFNLVKSGIMALLPGFDGIKKEIEKIKGVPVKTISSVDLMGAPVKSTDLLLESAEMAAPAGVYEIPEGFTQQSLLGN